jgi:hypothetical protein
MLLRLRNTLTHFGIRDFVISHRAKTFPKEKETQREKKRKKAC